GGWLGQVSVIDLLPHLSRDERESRRHVWHDALGLLQARQAALAAPCVLGHRTHLLAMRLDSSGKEWAVSTSPTCEIDPMVVVAAATEALGDLLTLRREALMRTAGRCECLRGLLQAHECLWGPARA
ncbi:MAG TPA: hypothetical protein VLQ80_04390, partial [Candidatus Saccharimonadia bacterium]|nr:hypothetical protein [Candidatus Saccharimonadia bacterium]